MNSNIKVVEDTRMEEEGTIIKVELQETEEPSVIRIEWEEPSVIKVKQETESLHSDEETCVVKEETTLADEFSKEADITQDVDDEMPGLMRKRVIFSCDTCGKLFLSENKLNIHKQEHLSEKSYYCITCNRVYNRLISFTMHKRITGHMRGLNNTFFTISDEEEIDDDRQDNLVVNANSSALPFSSAENQPYNINEVKNDSSKRPIQKIERKDSTFDSKTNLNKKRFFCDLCGKSFSRNYVMKKHKELHTLDEEIEKGGDSKGIYENVSDPNCSNNSFPCPVCDEKFGTKRLMMKHSEKHQIYICSVEFCKKKFGKEKELLEHWLHHTANGQHPCLVCGEIFAEAEGLEKHTVTQPHDTPLPCGACERDFFARDLLRHRVVHTSQRPFYCDLCNATFKYASAVILHRRKHLGKEREKKHFCYVCGKKFSSLNHVKSHMVMHTGEKRFQCHICSKFFISNSNKEKHVLVVHEGSDRYKRKRLNNKKIKEVLKKNETVEQRKKTKKKKTRRPTAPALKSESP